MAKRAGQVKRWSDDDDLYLRDMWRTITAYQIGQVLGRTQKSIVNRAYHLGIEGQHKNPSRLEHDAIVEDAAREMGCEDYYAMTGELPGDK